MQLRHLQGRGLGCVRRLVAIHLAWLTRCAHSPISNIISRCIVVSTHRYRTTMCSTDKPQSVVALPTGQDTQSRRNGYRGRGILSMSDLATAHCLCASTGRCTDAWPDNDERDWRSSFSTCAVSVLAGDSCLRRNSIASPCAETPTNHAQLAITPLTSPHLTSPHLTSPHLTSPLVACAARMGRRRRINLRRSLHRSSHERQRAQKRRMTVQRVCRRTMSTSRLCIPLQSTSSSSSCCCRVVMMLLLSSSSSQPQPATLISIKRYHLRSHHDN
jgi:hypothetical protein